MSGPLAIRKSTWITKHGEQQVAWNLDYIDRDGKRRRKKFRNLELLANHVPPESLPQWCVEMLNLSRRRDDLFDAINRLRAGEITAREVDAIVDEVDEELASLQRRMKRRCFMSRPPFVAAAH